MADSRYKTKQRTLISECMKENKEKALTVDGICEELKKRGVSVGRTTVYRYLDSLTKSGEVRRFSEEKGKSAAFQYVESHYSCNDHLHMKCSSCDKLVHLNCDFMSGVCAHLYEHHKFRVDNSKTTIFGICESCYAKEHGDGTD